MGLPVLECYGLPDALQNLERFQRLGYRRIAFQEAEGFLDGVGFVQAGDEGGGQVVSGGVAGAEAFRTHGDAVCAGIVGETAGADHRPIQVGFPEEVVRVTLGLVVVRDGGGAVGETAPGRGR